MISPTQDYLIVERYSDMVTTLKLPDSSRPGSNELYKVIAVGEGYHTIDGGLVTFNIKKGDVVFIIGEIQTWMYQAKEYIIARARDVIAIDRDPKQIDLDNNIITN